MQQTGTEPHHDGYAGGYEGRGGVQQGLGAGHSLTGGPVLAVDNKLKTNYFALLSTAYTCSPPNNPTFNTAIANTGASFHFLRPKAPVSNINHNSTPATVGIADGKLLHSSTTATIDLPHLPPGTNSGTIMPTFANNLLSMGVSCDAGCTVIFTSEEVTVTNSAGIKIMQGWREGHGARMWLFNLTSDACGSSQHHRQ